MTASTYRRPGPLAITDTEHVGLLGRDVVAQLT
jgi:hypothetical protein